MLNDEWWIRSLEELRDGVTLQDTLIIEMENSLAAYSFQANSQRSKQASKLRELLRCGCFPLEELYGFCKGEEVTFRGLEKQLAEQEERIRNSPKALICEPFWPVANDYYEKIIKPGCYWEGINPIRVDRVETESNLARKIKRALREANLFVADLTGNNPNVLYEVGHLEGRRIEGLFLSPDPGDGVFYTRSKDIIEIKLGPDGVAESRRRLREGLRGIKRKLLAQR